MLMHWVRAPRLHNLLRQKSFRAAQVVPPWRLGTRRHVGVKAVVPVPHLLNLNNQVLEVLSIELSSPLIRPEGEEIVSIERLRGVVRSKPYQHKIMD